MRSKRWAAVVLLTLITATSWAHALVFAVNEGVTYRVSNDEIRTRYAAVATDLARSSSR
jgi:hypothetical protein